jgi:hypothetical protein
VYHFETARKSFERMQVDADMHKPKGHLRNSFEVVRDAAHVQTPREVYEALAAQGYWIEYKCAIQRHAASTLQAPKWTMAPRASSPRGCYD